MPAAAQDLLTTLTNRLLRGMADDDRHQTRRVIGKLAVHFYPFISEWARNRARVDITLLLLSTPDETLASDCLQACDKANREAQGVSVISRKLDQIPQIADKVRKIERMLTGGEDGN